MKSFFDAIDNKKPIKTKKKGRDESFLDIARVEGKLEKLGSKNWVGELFR